MKPQVKNRFLRTALCCLLVLCGALLPSRALASYVPTPSCSINYTSYVKVSWSQSSDATYGYVIRRSTSSSYSSSSYLTRVTSKYTTTYYDYSATPGTTYYYWVCPVYRYTNGTYWYYYNTSNWDWGKRPVYVPTPSCSISYSSYVKVTWSTSPSSVYGYVIRRGTSSSYSSSSYLTRVTSKYTTTYYDYGAAPGVTYYYWVCPVYLYTNGSYWYYYNASNWDWGRKVR